jgi:isocitrate dehydrogenase
MTKIAMHTPLVEMDGDEMTRIIWRMIKDDLLSPYVDLRTEYYDLGLPNRDRTDDRVTFESAEATKRLGVAVKCATITPNAQRMEEYTLKRLYPSPNATIRAALDGTVFRAPIMVEGIKPLVPGWKKPITIARHAYGDIYKAAEFMVDEPGTVKLVYESASGVKQWDVMRFEGAGIAMGMHNTDASMRSFARSCFAYALDTAQDLWFAAKDTILKVYDGAFRDVFDQVFEQEGYKQRFEQAGISYAYTLIDDAVARVMRSEGGFIWACKNYDGDVMSDMVATAFGSLAMMTSVLVSPDGKYEYEAAHGTVTRHYYRHLKGENTSTNPIATLFAWTGALRTRAQMDDLAPLAAFADDMERAAIRTIEQGKMTGDLLSMSSVANAQSLHTHEFIMAIRETYETQCREGK